MIKLIERIKLYNILIILGLNLGIITMKMFGIPTMWYTFVLPLSVYLFLINLMLAEISKGEM